MSRVAPTPSTAIEAARTPLDQAGTWTGTFLWDPYNRSLNRNHLAGKWNVRIKAVAINQDFAVIPYWFDAPNLSFSVLNSTTTTMDALPPKVKKNASLSIAGRLQLADLETHTYVSFAGRPLRLQFRPTKGTFRDDATITVDAAGMIRTNRKASQSGCWRLAYPGDIVTSPATSSERCVVVG